MRIEAPGTLGGNPLSGVGQLVKFALRLRTFEHFEGYAPNLLDELVLGQRSLEELNLVPLASENVSARLVHVFQQQDLDVPGVERFELLGVGSKPAGQPPRQEALARGWRVESRRGRDTKAVRNCPVQARRMGNIPC